MVNSSENRRSNSVGAPEHPQAGEGAEAFFRSLLFRLHPPRLQALLRRVLDRADRRHGPSRGDTRNRTYARLRRQVIAQLLHRAGDGRSLRRRTAMAERLETAIPRSSSLPSADAAPDFHCDAGLGGLARWLRARGYDARFWPGIDDDRLLELAADSSAILLTTDRPLMQRGVLRERAIAGMLVPLRGGKNHQLAYVARRLQLPVKPPRCMQCGGHLLPVDKRTQRHRIPPRTYPVCHHYFLCRRCDGLFWRGTHWPRIEYLRQAGMPSSRTSRPGDGSGPPAGSPAGP